ncbi:hypothetical protein [Herbidospora cretacea]|uniref:hypothetical protein n=1 Tax=Herbidospora cretacea TaxID=28444 RepID=UPI00068E8652|nr:hypothetical protein [Herbidospora cretacea]
MNNKATLDKWVFVPGYYQGKTPWGIYVGKQAFTHYDFDVYEDGDRNYAFVTVYNGLKLPHGGLKDVKTLKDLGGLVEVSKELWLQYDIRFIDGGKYYIWKWNDAGRLGDNVGGQGLAYNQKVGQNVYVFGYPSGSHPDGNHAYSEGVGGNKRYDTSVSPYFDGETFGVYKAAANLWSGSIA